MFPSTASLWRSRRTRASADRRHRGDPLIRSGPILVTLTALLAVGAPPLGATPARPSVVLIVTDDQDAASLSDHMPNLQNADRRMEGATFTRAYYNDALCAPSRATLLTGRYAQNTQAHHGQPKGCSTIPANEASTLATWLHAAGYRTGFVGKYLNDYPEPAPLTYVPPGWDYWVARLGETEHETSLSSTEFDYDLNDNGSVVYHGSAADDYATDVYREKAVGFIKQAVADRVPVLPRARHARAALAGHARPARCRPVPDPHARPGCRPSTRRTCRDKPAYIRALAPFSPANIDDEVPAAGPLAAGGR